MTHQTGELPPQDQAAELQAIDPSLAQAGVEYLDQYPVTTTEGTALPPVAVESRDAAIGFMAEREREAIDRVPGASEKSAFDVTEAAQRDMHLKDIRSQVEAIYGSSATQEAVTTGVERSHLQTQEAAQVATAVTTGQAELPGNPGTINPEAATITNSAEVSRQFNALQDKVDGTANKLVDKFARRTRATLGSLGINMKRRDLAAEGVEAAGTNLTDTTAEQRAELETIGETTIGALVENKPTLKGAARTELMDRIRKDPSALKVVGTAARAYRQGKRGSRTYRQAGRVLNNLK